MIPDSNFITSLLNVSESDIESCHIRTDDDDMIYEITLLRKHMKRIESYNKPID